MKRIQIILWIFLATAFLFAEKMPDLIGFSDGKAAYIFLPHPIPHNQGVLLWKKEAGGSWKKALPAAIRPIDDPLQMQKLLGTNYAIVAKTMKDPDPARILTKLLKDPVYSLMLSFKVPRLSLLLGRLIVDTQIKPGTVVQYRVAFVDKGNQVLRKSKAIRITMRSPRFPEVQNLRVNVEQRMADISFSYPKFNWQRPDWVVGFRVYRSDNGTTYRRVGDDFIFRLDDPQVSLQDGLLSYGKTYWYKVTTISYFGLESKGCTPVKVYVKDREAPSIVQNIQAKFTGKGILLNWDLSPEPDVAGYQIFRGTSAEKVTTLLNRTLIPAVQTFYFDSTGREGEKYFYAVVAVDQAGNKSKKSARPYAVWEDRTPPPAPQWVKARYARGLLHISWKAVSAEKLRGYYVYRGMDKNHLVQVTPKPVGVRYPAFADSGNADKKFQFGKNYWVAVRAVDMAWNLSDYRFTQIVIPDTIPPQAVPDVMVDIRKNGDLYFSWNPSASSDVVRYLLSVAEVGSGQKALVKQVGRDTLKSAFRRLTKGKTYRLRIVALDAAGNRSKPWQKDIVVRDYVPPSHPRNVFVRKTKGGYRLSWNPVVDFDFVGYRIYRAKSPMGTYRALSKKLIKQEFYFLPLTAIKGYYQVRAVDSSGNESKKNEVVYIGK